MIATATVHSFNKLAHTCQVRLDADAANAPAIHASHALSFWQLRPGARCLVFIPDNGDTDNAVIIATFSGRQPTDPHFDPSTGHKHTGAEDDAPTI